jgi:hypothetical protein
MRRRAKSGAALSTRFLRRAKMAPALRYGAGAIAIFAVSACQALIHAPEVVPPEAMRLEASNETSVEIVLFVNGVSIRNLPPMQSVALSSSELPVLPWQAELRLGTGRTVLHLDVAAGDVTVERDGNGTMVSQGGDAVRIDLVCGRLDLWSGPPLLGGPPVPNASAAACI